MEKALSIAVNDVIENHALVANNDANSVKESTDLSNPGTTTSGNDEGKN